MQIHTHPDPLVALGAGSGELRVLIVADDPIVRDGFVARLGRTAAGQASLDDDVIGLVLRSGANVVLVDLGPRTDGDLPIWDTLTVPTVVLSAPGLSAASLLARGVDGVLARDVSPTALRSALEAVCEGLTVVEPALLREDLGSLNREHARGEPLLEPLTPRESEVLELLTSGVSNRELGERLGISTHTVKFHIAAILDKLDAVTRTEAVVRAVRLGLVMV